MWEWIQVFFRLNLIGNIRNKSSRDDLPHDFYLVTFCLLGNYLAMVGDILVVTNGIGLLASSGQRPGKLLNTLQCTE